jgi:hypothetical protein
MDADQDPEAVFAARVEGLRSGIEELRLQLLRASQSEVTGPELAASLRDFWRDQEPALRMVTATILESLRVQALEQAYGWREQIIRATEAQRDRR